METTNRKGNRLLIAAALLTQISFTQIQKDNRFDKDEFLEKNYTEQFLPMVESSSYGDYPGKLDLYIEFNNVLSETNSMFDINNIFDEKSKQCKKISLPTPTGCQTKPILLRDYIHIQNNHPTLFADCGNKPRLYDKIRKENYIIFDHLVPTSPHLKDFPDWYVTDLSFDAFKWDGARWTYIKDFDAKSLKILRRPFNDPNK